MHHLYCTDIDRYHHGEVPVCKDMGGIMPPGLEREQKVLGFAQVFQIYERNQIRVVELCCGAPLLVGLAVLRLEIGAVGRGHVGPRSQEDFLSLLLGFFNPAFAEDVFVSF
jgi:hypothetical protein